MATKQYQVTLEEPTVDEAKERAKLYGGKLSPILNSLLTAWIKDQDKMMKVVKDILETKSEEDKKE